MSKPRYDWWQYAIKIAEKWPLLREEYEDLHAQSVTPKLSGMPGGGGVSRAVEDIALRTLPGNKQREYDAARFALDEILRRPDAIRRREIVKLRYWDKTMTIAGAGMRVNFSERSARRICWRYILAIGCGMGFITKEEYLDVMRKDNN